MLRSPFIMKRSNAGSSLIESVFLTEEFGDIHAIYTSAGCFSKVEHGNCALILLVVLLRVEHVLLVGDLLQVDLVLLGALLLRHNVACFEHT